MNKEQEIIDIYISPRGSGHVDVFDKYVIKQDEVNFNYLKEENKNGIN